MIDFSTDEKDVIFSLCRDLTGSAASFRAEVVLHSVAQRMAAVGARSLMAYLEQVEQSPSEWSAFVSALTIHTTRWFREPNHFQKLEAWLLELMQSPRAPRHLKLLSAGCSTGEEAASLALVCEVVRQQGFSFSYEVIGFDIDPVSIDKARKGVTLGASEFTQIPVHMQRFLKPLGERSKGNLWGLQPAVASNIHFVVGSLVQPLPFAPGSMDVILCRNVLIYFDESTCYRVVQALQRSLNPGGLLLLGTHEHTALGAGSQSHGETAAPPSHLILLGASTGGPPVLESILGGWPHRPCPPVVVVQHISPDFMANFRQRLAQSAGLSLAQCGGEEPLQPNTLYTPAGAHHLLIKRRERDGLVTCTPWAGGAVGGHLPSVDVTFQSAAQVAGLRLWAALLTGMGTDGAKGLLDLKGSGAATLAQSEESCAVFGMPKKAIALGAAQKVGSPTDIRRSLEEFVLLAGRSRPR